MKKVVAFAGSNSKNSVNKQLAAYAAGQLSNAEVEVLDLNDFELPMYGIDYEMAHGIPQKAQDFLDKVQASDGLVISLAEHNGAYAAVFKNLFDWMSRIDGKLWADIPMLLMATSPGARGGATVLEVAKGRFPYMGGNIVADFSLPSFGTHFSDGGINDSDLQARFQLAISKLNDAL